MDQARYSTGAIWLHWLIAAAIALNIALGWRTEEVEGAALFATFQLHKSLGITILLLTLARIAWRLTHRPPPYESSLRPWEKRLADWVHIGFYGLLLALPLSGWLAVSTSRLGVPTILYGLVPWPHVPGTGGLDQAVRQALNEGSESVHETLVKVAYLLIVLHIAGALKHHFLDRKAGLDRMAPGAVPGRWADWRLGAILAVAIGGIALGKSYPWTPPAPAAPTAEPAPEPQEQTPAVASQPAPSPEAKDADEAEKEDAEAKTLSDRWTVERSGSTLGFRTNWSGAALTGRFGSWDADIRFDPAALDKASVRVTVSMGSVSASDSNASGALPGGDWFDADKHPKAVFTARDFRARGGDRYEARGTLKLRGVERPVTMPFTLRIDQDRATMRGSATIDRLAYGVGQGEWQATDQVPADVTVEVNLRAVRRD